MPRIGIRRQWSGMDRTSEIVSLPLGIAQVEWRRNTRARRVSLRIDPRGGSVVVTLPSRAGRGAGMALLQTHADWITTRLASLPGRVAFTDGAELPIAGVIHTIRHVPAARGGAWLHGTELQVAGHAEHLSRRVLDFLRTEAQRRLTDLVAIKAAQLGIRPHRITVKDTISRWGSCAADGSLAFSWRLVMAPHYVQDYVVAHEVAHLRHLNHGSQFWALVAELTDHMEPAMRWLRQEGIRLLRIG